MDNMTSVLVQGVLLPSAAGSVGKGECATSRRLQSVATRPSPLEIPPVPKQRMHSYVENIPKNTQTHLLILITRTKLSFRCPCANSVSFTVKMFD